MPSTFSPRILIVGGVAGGLSAATRLRRLDESADITVFESGSYIGYANCGIPYVLGGIIEDEADLILNTPESMKRRFNVDVHLHSTVTAIHRNAKEILVRDGRSGNLSCYSYDYLILAQGAEAIRLSIPGAQLPQVFNLQTIADLEAVKHSICQNSSQRAVVIGGGFIGLEAVENLSQVCQPSIRINCPSLTPCSHEQAQDGRLSHRIHAPRHAHR
jgi:NADPH-dependent 2,4-dienoyl-CoA reductase/sulfur reductase-like enzyme